MTWLTAIIAIILIVFFAIASPGFRKFLLLLFAGVVVASVGAYFYFDYESRERERKELALRTLIASSEVEFQNLVMSNTYGSWKIKGVVKNNSRYQIEKIKLNIQVSNCDENKRNCVVVGADDDVTSYIDIPPSQARGLETYVTLRNLPELTHWSWAYYVGYIQAKR